MKLLNNLSITAKSLISTLIGVLVVIGMAVLAISGFVAFQGANDLQSVSTALMTDARDGWIDLARGQAALYRAINLKSQNVEVGLIRRAKGSGYAVRLVFVGVPTVEDAIERVAARVTKGGHDVRESDIRRRWPIAHTNLARAVPMVDEVLVLSNSGYGAKPTVVAVAKAGEVTLLDPNALPAVTAVLVPLIGP